MITEACNFNTDKVNTWNSYKVIDSLIKETFREGGVPNFYTHLTTY
jgi:hypothetical protein